MSHFFYGVMVLLQACLVAVNVPYALEGLPLNILAVFMCIGSGVYISVLWVKSVKRDY